MAVVRGGIYWARLNPTVGVEIRGTRPVLIVSIDSFNQNSRSAIAFAITSQKPKVVYPFVYELPDNTLPKTSWVKISQIRTLSISRLGDKIGQIQDVDVERILQGFNRLTGL